MLEGLRTPMDLVVTVVILLSYGCPMQAIVHESFSFTVGASLFSCNPGFLSEPAQ